ncbi:hypothetical protein IW140_001907 [Coemansia sp. RSA 1813]|nr:hypothetical protein EV178_005074 [Coemansia sp. RSA 1646]KAJ1769910.1 hypothetical protein LPJ74_003631 [Coemansia sp. RSA 1843]KAJ2087248.1 hypothetical protein IW138_005094 [Coemansia sp. RSA 986]KAJ2212090.1 hypothetical protein EV179_004952 [Coemansia sp. RSA 487]KAJ2570953.1 hypothetical protein IW140_001907 [Coemansia sp. RSA 1813]
MVLTAAIIGATGIQGGSVLRALHAAGKYKLTAVTRDASSAASTKLKSKYPDVKLVEANLDDAGSLKNAFKGADIVFGVTQFLQPDILSRIAAGDIDAELNQGKNVTDAAIASGVKNIIFSTMYSMSELTGGKYPDAIQSEGKYKIEKYIRSKAAEIRSAFIYLGCYMDNFINGARISTEDSETVEFTFMVKPTTKIPLVDTANDTGGVVSHMLDHFDDFVGKAVEVSGGYYEAQEMARAFTEVTGKPARYVQLPYESMNSIPVEQMFRSFDEFGYFGWKTDFLEINKKMSYKHTTPVEFWKSSGWTGPSQ